jgi:hypothetical protein
MDLLLSSECTYQGHIWNKACTSSCMNNNVINVLFLDVGAKNPEQLSSAQFFSMV